VGQNFKMLLKIFFGVYKAKIVENQSTGVKEVFYSLWVMVEVSFSHYGNLRVRHRKKKFS
jgi:hypothetical protein